MTKGVPPDPEDLEEVPTVAELHRNGLAERIQTASGAVFRVSAAGYKIMGEAMKRNAEVRRRAEAERLS